MPIIHEAEKFLKEYDAIMSRLNPPEDKFREEWELETIERMNPQLFRLAVGYLRSFVELIPLLRKANIFFDSPEYAAEWMKKFKQITGDEA